MAESILLTEDEKNMTTEDGENILLESSGGVGVMTVSGNITGSGEDVGPLDYSPPPKGVYVQKYSPVFRPRITK